jgi:hypothetical protein
MKYTNTELIEMIIRTHQKIGRRPQLKDVKENGGAGKNAFIRAFGSYRVALNLAMEQEQFIHIKEFALEYIKKAAESYTECMQDEEYGEPGFKSLSARIIWDVLDLEYIYPEDYCYDFYDEEFGNITVHEMDADENNDWLFNLTSNYDPDFRVFVLWDKDHTFIESVYLVHYTRTSNQTYIRFRDLQSWTSCELPVKYFNRCLRRMLDDN